MNARRLVLPAVVAAVIVTGGCTKPKPGEDSRPEAPPSTPAPGDQGEKSTAELLVGKWQKVSRGDAKTSDSYILTMTYTHDGAFIIHVEKSRDGPRPPREGAYRLEGDTIWLHTEATSESMAYDWSVQIKEITNNKLHIAAPEDPKGSQYKRFK